MKARLPFAGEAHEMSTVNAAVLRARRARQAAVEWAAEHTPDAHVAAPEWVQERAMFVVALVAQPGACEPVGELWVTGDGDVASHADPCVVGERLNTCQSVAQNGHTSAGAPRFADVQSSVVLGDAAEVLPTLPVDAAQLVFTSPPYFNAMPEYFETSDYDSYLAFVVDVIAKCHAVLSEGRFLVLNTSPVIVRRAHRQAQSRRYAIPFDLHPRVVDLGFDFIDDVCWVKPEGSALGRNKRFAGTRKPLTYKTTPVVEYLMVYRKRTDKLIDWNVHQHPDPSQVVASLVGDGYERTNVWQMNPSTHPQHPATFPDELAQKVIRYYSFVGDLVLDPFAGTGTTARAAATLGRRFTMIERSPDYHRLMMADEEIATAMDASL